MNTTVIFSWLALARHWFPLIALGTSIVCFLPMVNLLVFPRYVCGGITAVLLYYLFMGATHNLYVFGGLLVVGFFVIPKLLNLVSLPGLKTYIAALINIVLVIIIWAAPILNSVMR